MSSCAPNQQARNNFRNLYDIGDLFPLLHAGVVAGWVVRDSVEDDNSTLRGVLKTMITFTSIQGGGKGGGAPTEREKREGGGGTGDERGRERHRERQRQRESVCVCVCVCDCVCVCVCVCV